MTFGEKLQYLRKQKGLSQEQLALQLTVSRQAISKWELGASLPDTENIVQISSIFDVSTDYLLKEDTEQIANLSTPIQMSKSKVQGKLYTKVMMLVGGIGVLGFWILSSIFPAVVSFAEASANGEEVRTIVKTGLPAFLEMNNMELLFVLCCAVFMVGVVMHIATLVKAKTKNSK